MKTLTFLSAKTFTFPTSAGVTRGKRLTGMGSKREAKPNKKEKKKYKKDSLKSDPSPLVPESHGEEENAGGGGRKVVTDPRFSSVHWDPRFREAPKHKTKVAIDSRFDRLFNDKRFLPSSAPVNKRGKPQKRNTQQGFLRHYYRTEEVEKVDDEDEKEVEDNSEEDEEREREELVKPNLVKPGDEEGGEYETSEEEDQGETDESESSTDIDEEEGVYDDEMPDTQEEVPEIEKETHRLAVVNMDWRYVKAVDLLVLLSSFVPPNGQIKSVVVYPSEFGLQRMKEEEVQGPVGLFDDDDDDAISDGDSRNDDVDNEKLRAYETNRLRYYYAVVECDSSTTADYIYKECDGLEFIQSSNALDLRFIPDTMEFKHPPRDVATEAPSNYEFKDFYTRALQHSKVNLSWDEDEPLRMRTLKRKFNDEQLAELELKEFLNSDETESDDDEEINETEDKPDKKTEKREKYRALLQSGDCSDEDDGQDMEVTFNTGLEDISKRILEKRDKQSETVWEAYLLKRREKKKARKNKSKNLSDDDSSDTDQEATEEAADDDFFIDEDAPKKSKKQSKNDKARKHQDMDGVDKASKEELELLLADDKGTGTGLRGYNSKFKKGKGKRGRKSIDEEKLPSTDDIDEDPRFKDFFNKPEFALDPTDPQFKRSAAYGRQLARKQHKRDMDLLAEEGHNEGSRVMPLQSDRPSEMKGEKNESDDLQSKKEKYDLSSLVKSIKMKSKQVQLPSDGKKHRGGKLLTKVKEKSKHYETTRQNIEWAR